MDEVDGSDCAGCRSVDDMGEDQAGGDETNSGALSLLEALMRVFRRYLEMHDEGGAGQSQDANPSSGAMGKAIIAAIALLKHLRFDSEESCLRALRLFFRWPRKLLAGQAIAAEDVVRRELSQLENGVGGRADDDLNIPPPPPGPKRRKLSTTKVEGENKDVAKSLKEKEKDAKKQLQERRRIRFNQATAYVNRFVEGMISAVETNVASHKLTVRVLPF
eukprot:g8247.t1